MKKHHFFIAWLFAVALIVPGLYSLARAHPFSTPYATAYCKLTGCTITGSLSATNITSTAEATLTEGFEATGDFDTKCSDASTRGDLDGLQACGPLTDVAAAAMNISAQSAAPLGSGSTTGANVVIRPGSGTHKAVMTAASWVNATTTFTLTVDGTALTGTEGTAFECDSVTDTVCANNVANYYEGLAGAAGVHACSSGSTTTCTAFGFTGVAGTVYFFPAPEDSPGKFIDLIACSTGAAATLTNGTNGDTVVHGDLLMNTTTGKEIIFAIDNDAVTPSLQFEPGTGCYASADATIKCTLNGVVYFTSTTAATTIGSTVTNFVDGRSYISTTAGLVAANSSAVAWLFQSQTAMQDARVIGSADAAAEVATTLGTATVDGSITGTTTRLARFATDCDGTPSEKAWVSNQGAFVYTGIAFADLCTPANGTTIYCSDCTEADPCAGSGTGAFAMRLNGRWDCN